MDENNNSSAIRLLVDALSKTLQSLSDKISSFQPILTQISQSTNTGCLEINQILYDIKNIEKTFDALCKDFYDRTDSIIRNIDVSHNKIENVVSEFDKATIKVNELFKERSDDISQLLSQKTSILNDSLDEKTKELVNVITTLNSSIQTSTKDLISKINDVSKNVRPVSKFFNYISKPIGLLIFIFSLLIASVTITNVTSATMSYFKTTMDNYQKTNK
jgi:methyl-accepting chemotaxis protein